jgi:hypothetical protein
MRKKLLLLLLSTSSVARAGSELKVEIKGGPDAATQDAEARVSRYGFTGGLAGHLGWPLVGPLSLAGQLELLYTPRGAETIFENDYLGRIRLHYFDVSIAARPEVRLRSLNVYALLGGGLDLLLSVNKENASGVGMDVTKDFHRMDVSFLIGAGAALHLPPKALGPLHLDTVFVEARYDYGLLDADAVNGGFKNRTASLMLGLSLALDAETQPIPSMPPSSSGHEPDTAP